MTHVSYESQKIYAPLLKDGSQLRVSDTILGLQEPIAPDIPGFTDFKLIGRGGMGLVFRAMQTKLHRSVALKMMIGGAYADPQLIHRFRGEAEAIAHLDHPNIVPIYEVGEWKGLLYFTMKYVEGGTLSQYLRQQKRDARQMASILAIIARALHYAHQRGILHRDLKPSNILLDDAIRPYIMDFGLSKRVDATEALTGSQVCVGTPGYLAPEQAMGEKTATIAVDIWGLGTILYETLTGQAPHSHETPIRAVQEVLSRDPRRPRSIVASIDPDLETICMKCLSREPHRRYATALEVADDLTRWLQCEPIHARSVTTFEKCYRWMKRRPGIALLSGSAILSFMLAVVGITIALMYALAGWHRADQESQRVSLEQKQTERRRSEAETNLYFSRLAQAGFEEKSSNSTSANRLLELCIPEASHVKDHRNWEWHYLKGLLNADLLTISNPHQEIVYDLQFSPDGNQLLSAGGSPYKPYPADAVRIWNLWGDAAGNRVREFSQSRFAQSARYGDQGNVVLWFSADKQRLHRFDLRNSQESSIPLLDKTVHATLSADGSRVLTHSTSDTFHVVDSATGKVLTEFQKQATIPNQWNLSPDGTMLALSLPTSLYLRRVASNEEWVPALNGAVRSRPQFSGDSQLVAIGLSGGVIRVFNSHGKVVQSLSGHDGDVKAIAFNPTNTHIASTGADRTVRLWSIATGEELLRLRGHQGRGMCLAFHPSGRFLASGTGQPSEIKLWDLTRGQECLNIKLPQRKRVEAMGFGADGQLRIARAAGSVEVFDADSGQEGTSNTSDLALSNLRPATVGTFSDDGKWLCSIGKNLQEAHVTALNGSGQKKVFQAGADIAHVAWSSTKHRLSTSSPGTEANKTRHIQVWDFATGESLAHWKLPDFSDRLYGPIAFSPDGESLAYEHYLPENLGVERRCIIRLRQVASGEVFTDLPDTLPRVERIAFNRQGTKLALSCENRGVLLYDLLKKRWMHDQPLQASSNRNSLETFWDLAFSPDGERLAAVNRVQVLLWDVTSGQLVLTLRGAPPPVGDNGFNPRIVWSADGKKLAASNSDTSFSIWDAADRQSPTAKEKLHSAALKRNLP